MARVLVSTISSKVGGIATVRRFVIATLRSRGYEPVLAFYEPYSLSPHLSVPSFRLLQRRAGSEIRYTPDGCEAHAIGAWLPELEFTHYLASPAWKRVIDGCCAYLAVAGNALASLPYSQTGRPFVACIASGWHMDRRDRAQQFTMGRRVVDRVVTGPVVRRLERALLRNGVVLATSHYTQHLLDDIAGTPVVKDILPIPIDTDFFSPAPNKGSNGRIGFCGRLSDPRKNVELLLVSLHRLSQAGHAVNALLIGSEPNQSLRRRIQELDIGDCVEICSDVTREVLRDKLRTIDVFVVPSHQEGLCIAALEAMACGCPVVSTRCGGPEDFVLHDETGFLVGYDPAEMADSILRILGDPKLRRRLGEAARERVIRDYSYAKATSIFWSIFDEQFAGTGLAAA